MLSLLERQHITTLVGSIAKHNKSQTMQTGITENHEILNPDRRKKVVELNRILVSLPPLSA